MLNFFTKKITNKTIAIIPIIKDQFGEWLKKQPIKVQNWLNANNFQAKSATFCLLPKDDGELEEVFLGLENADDFWAFGALAQYFNAGEFQIQQGFMDVPQLQRASIAWGLGCYQFNKYKKSPTVKNARLFLADNCDQEYIENTISAIYLVRDLVNLPAEALGPNDLAKFVKNFAAKFKADFNQFVGSELITKNFPTVHIIGRASHREPHLIELRWQPKNAAKCFKLSLVGKGVCFDTGGLDIKSDKGMLDMHADMGGAALCLGLTEMIISANLPIALHVVIPAVENVVSGSSVKPRDVLVSRKGISIEINDTDAEGRVILADALTYAAEDKPDLLIDFATLTGAAEVALGDEIASMFTANEKFAEQIMAFAKQENDPVWHLPFHEAYRTMLDSNIADIRNYTETNKAGAITAALFLREFVPENINWVHFDLSVLNAKKKPGRPEGGEALAIRGIFKFIEQYFCSRRL